MSTTPPLEGLADRLRADLDWLASAPALVTGSAWGPSNISAVGSFGDFDRDLALAALRTKLSAGLPRRLGKYFEEIHEAALRHVSGVDVLACGRVLGHRHQTLGELDVLFRRPTGAVVHREVAVKFYLSLVDSSQPQHWVGPGLRDRLAIKMARLTEHQLKLPQFAQLANLWPADLPMPEVSEVLLLGQFFSHPTHTSLPLGASSAGHHGFWCRAREFEVLAGDRFGVDNWAVLSKPWWLSHTQAQFEEPHSAQEIVESVRQGQLPLLVAMRDDHDGPFASQGFVVPNDWGTQLDAPG